MTYRELLYKAQRLINHNEITLGEYDEMTKPLDREIGTCKDCTNYVVGALDEEICIRGHELIHKDFYCADYGKQGGKND